MKLFWQALTILILAATLGCHSTGGPAAKPTARLTTTDTALIKEKLAKAEKGDAEAQYDVGKFYANGRGVLRDQSEAVKWFSKAADQGHAKAQTAFGWAYFRGEGVAEDFDEAVKWFNKAADQGDADAKVVLLGFAMEAGDYENAGKELREIAEQGNSTAQTLVGFSYTHRAGVTKDDAEAVKWFLKAAEQKNPTAQALLGLAYLEGRGVTTNYSEAIKWSRKAAEHGNPLAQENLGRCYQAGYGVKKNAPEAVKWFKSAAEQGHADAEASLGLAYRQGQGVTQDYVQAYKWLALAAVHGNSSAASAREDLVSLMSPEQRTRAGVVPRRHLTKFNRQIIDTHKQTYNMSCIPSSVEMVLKLIGRVPESYYEQQDAWKNKADGSFHNFDGKTIEGVTFRQQFTQAHNSEFPLAELFETIDRELKAGRFVIVGIACPGGTHNWVIYDEDAEGEFLAVSKNAVGTIEDNHVKKTITQMKGTDIGTYDLKP